MHRFEIAAQNVIKLTHLNSNDRCVLITDLATIHIVTEIDQAVSKICPCLVLKIEDYMTRPAHDLTVTMVKTITDFHPTISIYAATGLEGELKTFRGPLRELLNNGLNCRHAHMININDTIMQEGMCADYMAIQDLSQKLKNQLQEGHRVRVKSDLGTSLTIDLDNQKYRWVASDGVIDTPGEFENLPSGEVFSTPKNVNGIIAGEVVGDYLCAKYGVLPSPLLITIKDNIIESIKCDDGELQREFEEYVKQEVNGNRVGEIAIGTNISLTHLIGNLLQDEKYPGFHLAFGYPYPDDTGADWTCGTHIDVVTANTIIWIDDQLIMDHGMFLV